MPRGINERYRTATHASDLRVEAERGGQADVIIAAGMSKCDLGVLLIRLCSEWDSAEKIHRGKASSRKINKADLLQAADWELHEQKMLMGKLKTLPAVRRALIFWSILHFDIEDENHIAAILLWWLDHVCKGCNGLRYRRILGTPSLSNKFCLHCHGTGEVKIPEDPENPRYLRGCKKMLAHLSECVKNAAASMDRLSR